MYNYHFTVSDYDSSESFNFTHNKKFTKEELWKIFEDCLLVSMCKIIEPEKEHTSQRHPDILEMVCRTNEKYSNYFVEEMKKHGFKAMEFQGIVSVSSYAPTDLSVTDRAELKENANQYDSSQSKMILNLNRRIREEIPDIEERWKIGEEAEAKRREELRKKIQRKAEQNE